MQHSMDRGKPDAAKAMMHRKGHNGHTIGLKNTSMELDKNAHFCNRVGCNGRIKYGPPNTRNGSSEKAKFSIKPPFSSSNRNEMGASSKGSVLDSKRKTSPQSGFDLPGSGQSGMSEVSSPSKNLAKHHLASKNEISGEIRPRKGFHHKSEPNKRSTRPVFSAHSNSKSSSLRTLYNRSSSSSSSSNINRNNSYSNNSSSNSSTSGRSSGFFSSSSSMNVMKNKNHGAKNSFPRPGWLNGHLCPSASGISISSSGSSNPASGDSKSATRRLFNASSGRPRLSSYHQNGRIHSSSLYIGGPRSYASHPSSNSSSYSFSGGNPENRPDMMPFTTDELDFTHLMNGEQYNMDGIAEVLLAMERIEQDEELTREQVLALETNLFPVGLNLYDRHRDMRLDIDNMSYEELLALEERMGTVSTALSEEALSECIKTSPYHAGPPGPRLMESSEGDDLKCSICQEEYMAGEEIGQLVVCLHKYHGSCIYQWLRFKNWCPICKAGLKE